MAIMVSATCAAQLDQLPLHLWWLPWQRKASDDFIIVSSVALSKHLHIKKNGFFFVINKTLLYHKLPSSYLHLFYN